MILSFPSAHKNNSQQIMSKNSGVPETLAEIVGVAIEHDLHLEPNRFINYVDLYRQYLLVKRESTQGDAYNPAGFYQFINSQTLLEIAASEIEIETGEPIAAPKTLHGPDTETPARPKASP